jgi:hypothetical protein
MTWAFHDVSPGDSVASGSAIYYLPDGASEIVNVRTQTVSSIELTLTSSQTVYIRYGKTADCRIERKWQHIQRQSLYDHSNPDAATLTIAAV